MKPEARFYLDWMTGKRVRECVDSAAKVTTDQWPLPVLENKDFTNTVNGVTYRFNGHTTSRIFIVGFPGLQVDRTDHALDGDKKYVADENLE